MKFHQIQKVLAGALLAVAPAFATAAVVLTGGAPTITGPITAAGTTVSFEVAITSNDSGFQPDSVAFTVEFDSAVLSYTGVAPWQDPTDLTDPDGPTGPLLGDDAWTVAAAPSNVAGLGSMVTRKISGFGPKNGLTPGVCTVTLTTTGNAGGSNIVIALDTTSSNPVTSVQGLTVEALAGVLVNPAQPELGFTLGSTDSSALQELSVAEWTLLD